MNAPMPLIESSRGAQDAEVQVGPDGMPTTEEQVWMLLSQMADRMVNEAVTGRQASGIEDEWATAEDLNEGRDELTVDQRGRANITGKTSTPTRSNGTEPVSRILVNIIRPRVRDLCSRVKEMLVPSDGKRPWDLRSTPVPDLLDAAADTPAEDADPASVPMVQMADGEQRPKHDVAKYLLSEAEKSSEKMKDWIEDHLVECGDDTRAAGRTFYAELRKVIDSAGVYGTGCVKGPFPIVRTYRRWVMDEATGAHRMTIVSDQRPISRFVDIRNCFPDPNCGDNIHTGSYFVERDFLTTKQLRGLAGIEGYNSAAIARCVMAGPRSGSRQQVLTGRMNSGGGNIGVVVSQQVFEIFHLYAEVDMDTIQLLGADLDENGKSVLSEEDQALQAVPCMVTMCNGEAIKVSINPLESGEFPFDFFCWEKVTDRPWGKGIPIKGESAQRVTTAALRRLMENSGVSAGPQIVKAKNVTPANQRNEIVGRKLWEFAPDDLVDDVRKAFAVFNIESRQAELLAIIKTGIEMLDLTVGSTLLMQGITGSAPETLGGMQLALQQAASPLRDSAKTFDDDLIVPHLTRWHDLGMQAAPDDCKKGDAKVVPLGSSALLMREMVRVLLQQLWPLAGDPELKLSKTKLFDEMCQAFDFDPDKVKFTPEEWQKHLEEMKAMPSAPAPQVQVAQIREQGATQREQMKMQVAGQDQQVRAYLANVEKEIEIMRLSGSENISIMEIRAMLTRHLSADRTQRDIAASRLAATQEELSFAAVHGKGI